jgi:AAA family ATP:ADP antiporter
LGGCTGAALSYFQFKRLGASWLMLLGGAVLVVAVLCTLVVNRRASSKAGTVQHRLAQEPIGRKGGFRLIFSSRYLFLIAALIVVLNLVNTTGEFLKDTLFVASAGAATGAARETILGEWASIFNEMQNVMVLVLQLFFVSRIFRHFGVRVALFILPLIAFGGYTLLAVLPMLYVAIIAKALENSADYSIQNTARQALFLPTSREAKYKAKIAIDTFFTRSGDMLCALLVFAGSGLFLTVRHYAALNVFFVVVWLVLVAALCREHKKQAPAASQS